MHFLPDIPILNFLFWFPVLGFWSNSGGNKSSTSNETATSSGQNSPNATGGSQALGSGSIGVAGNGAKYLEQGATDASGSQFGGVSGSSLSASGGGTINIGDPQATQTVAALAQNFADTVQSLGSGGGGSTVVTSAPGSGGGFFSSFSGIAVMIGLGLFFLLALFRGGKKA